MKKINGPWFSSPAPDIKVTQVDIFPKQEALTVHGGSKDTWSQSIFAASAALWMLKWLVIMIGFSFNSLRPRDAYLRQ